MVSSHLLGTEAIRRSIVHWSVLYHSRNRMANFSSEFRARMPLIRLSRSSHKFSIGFKSGIAKALGGRSLFRLEPLLHYGRSVLVAIILLKYPSSGDFFSWKRKHVLLQYLLVHISAHVFINTHKGTDGRCTETSPYSSRSTTVLDSGHLVFWVESGTHRTSNPPFLTISKHIKLGFVAPKNFRPLHAWPVLMRLRPIFSFGQLFFGDKRFTNPNPTI